MPWTTPKTNWTDGDYFNISDWNRMRNNLLFLRQNKGAILGDIAGIEIPALTQDQIPSAWELNQIVNATQDMIDRWVSPVGARPMRLLQNDEMSWTASDLNSIESNHQIIHDELLTLQNWSGIGEYVRSGKAKKAWAIGTVFNVTHSDFGTREFVVVGHNLYKSANDPSANTMTIMMNSILYKTVSFSNKQAFYYAESALAAGQYHFRVRKDTGKWKIGDYQFTLSKPVPAGGQLVFSSNRGTALTSQRVDSYASPTATTYIDHVAITTGTGGTDLGVLGSELNDVERASHGSNNYKESPVRQFLNSTKTSNVWTAATHYDRYPTWMDDTAGYLSGFPATLLNILGECVIPCVANSEFEAPDSTTKVRNRYNVSDKVTIPSSNEMFGYTADITDGSKEYTYYSEADARKRRMRAIDDGTLYPYLLRTPVREGGAQINLVGTDGEPTTRTTNASSRIIVPVLNIV